MLKKIMLLFVSGLFLFSVTDAQTDIPAGNVSGTWTKANSPYRINGNITIQNATTLTIEAGVKVEFQEFYKLTVEGQLLAVGTQTDTIEFTINDTTGFYHYPESSAGAWHGIRFENNTSADSSKIVYCKLHYSKATDDDNNSVTEDDNGGAIYVNGFSKLLIQNCLITHNKATKKGGAIYEYESELKILKNSFLHNDANSGGALYCKGSGSLFNNATIQYNIIDNNSSVNGAGIYTDYAKIYILNNQIINNTASFMGGGIYAYYTTQNIIENNKIINNTSDLGGGIHFAGNYSSQVSGNVIANNYITSSNNNGAGIYVQSSSNLALNIFNNTIVNNQGSGIHCGDKTYIKNTILWGNTNQVTGSSSNIYIDDDNCTWQDVSLYAIHGEYPQFVNPSSGTGIQPDAVNADWSLQPTSPAINLGKADTTGLSLPDTDLAGNPRYYDKRVDIGAYELYKPIERSGTISENTTWIADTVNITGDITIENGITLTILDSTVVNFMGHYKIDVRGNLLAQGTKTDTITFTINNTTDFNNTANNNGGWGGMLFTNTATSNDSSIFEYCRFEYGKSNLGSNDYDKSGGAIFINTFSKIAIKHCSFSNNYASQKGGAVFITNANPVFEETVFSNNKSGDYAGAVAFSNNALPTFVNNIICNNEASNGGALLFSASNTVLTNNTIANNKASSSGGAIYCESNSSPHLKNAIIYGNTASSGNQVYLSDNNSNPDFYFCNVKGNSSAFGLNSGVTYGGNYENNYDYSPMFTSPTAGSGTSYNGLTADWSLETMSSCINAGDKNSTGLPSLDYFGNNRIYSGRIDLGAIELQQSKEICGHITEDAFWAGDTVKITCETTVNTDVTLTIEPGTVVDFSGYYSLIVEGTIIAQGTKTDSIIFSTTDEATGWHGIRFEYNISTDSSKFRYCRFEYGKGTGSSYEATGGAIYSDDFDLILIENSLFTANSAIGGGAIYLKSASPVIVNNRFINNNGGNFYGGAISCEQGSATIINNLFSNNTAEKGGAISISSNIVFINNTLANNYASTYGGGIHFNGTCTMNLKNCIIYGNTSTTGDQIFLLDDNSDPDFTNCDIQGGTAAFGLYPGVTYNGTYTNNIDSDPQFTNPSSGVGNQTDANDADWSLKGISPCINAATDTTGLNLPTLDLADNSRVVNSKLDIGGYESKVAFECGNITQNTIWNADTVKVNCNITVDDGSTLEITSGTHIEFQGHYKIDVQGRLLAEGEENSLITFTINDTTGFADTSIVAGGWSGIRFDETPTTNDTSKFAYCKFEYGKASTESSQKAGGAIFVNHYSKLTIDNSVFSNNMASGSYSSAGAVYITNTSDPVIKNCLFFNNTVKGPYYGGGGAICVSASSPTIHNNKFFNNIADSSSGGAIYCMNGSTSQIVNNLFANNYARYGGGIMFATNTTPTVYNNTFAYNKSKFGGGFAFYDNSNPVIKNNILYANTDSAGGAQVYIFDNASNPDFSYCDIQGGSAAFDMPDTVTYTGNYTNNINSTPLFTNPTAGAGIEYDASVADWTLQGNNPCINTGTPDIAGMGIPELDLAKKSRVYNNIRIDIGAYEYQNNLPEISAQNFNVDENSNNSTVVNTVAATDVDHNTLSFEIISGNVNGAFSIDNSGILKVANKDELNYETVAGHNFVLTIKTTDNGTGNLYAEADITVNINDINDTPEMVRDTFEIVENLGNGTFIMKLHATDEDVPAQTLSYSIISGNYSNCFTISTDSIFVSDSSGLNFETTASGNIRIKVEDTQGAYIYQYVDVFLRDTNDTPKISNQTFTIDEQIAVGTAAGTVIATDEDLPAQTLSYSIIGGNDNTAFAINTLTGELTINNSDSIDYEIIHSQTITVQVVDNGTGSLFSSAAITINLNNINDNAPVFNDTTVYIDENSFEGTLIASLNAYDVDNIGGLTFSFVSGNENTVFYLQNSNGNNLYVSKYDSMNYELYPSFELLMSVSDGDSVTQATVTVVINDLNEYPILESYSFNIAENADSNAVVGTILATDPDNGQTLYYYITQGNYIDAFVLDSVTGIIHVLDSTKLDHEGNYSNFSLTIKVKDNGTPQLSAINYASITIDNVNEPPVIEQQTFHVYENASANTPVGNIQAVDEDAGSTMSFSVVSGNENNVFSLNTSGALTVTYSDSIDYETKPVYSFVVEVSDNLLTDTATITIMVDNINEEPIVQPDTFYVDENSVDNTVIDTVVVIDPDGDNIIIYQISDVIPYYYGVFGINNSGVLSVVNTTNYKLDYESNPEFKLVVLVQDENYGTGHDTITLMLNDLNEAPIIIENQYAAIDEHTPNGTIVDTVKTITDAGEMLTYEIISGNEKGGFNINSSTGVITVANTDTILPQYYELNIKVTDNSSEQFSSNGEFYIEVINVNDPPVISHQVFYYTNENPYSGDYVGVIVATDPEYNPITYTIESGNTNDAFQITSSAELQVNNPDALNPDDMPTYNLLVRAADNEYSDTAIITVNLFPSAIIDNNTDKIFDIYPNPVKDNLYFSFKYEVDNINIEVYDINNRLVFNKGFDTSGKIDMSKYEKGIYMVMIKYKGHNYIKRIVLE